LIRIKLSGTQAVRGFAMAEAAVIVACMMTMPTASHDRASTRIAHWLFACCAVLFVLIVVGGITRLTRSGLSIVEWRPIDGILPPLTEAQWLAEFDKYRQTPEYLQVNRGMSLDAFKGIYWWEYIHRVLGRLLGLVFLLPFVWFWLRDVIGGVLRWKLAGIFVLGGLQGAMGWYMVQSGLVDDPRVSHLRLTAHLTIAFLIFAAMFWVGLDLLRAARGDDAPTVEAAPWLRRLALAVLACVFMMIVTGGLVAGIRAGMAYNTFPLMNGRFVPPEIMMLEPWYLNFVNNMATVQFDHRLFAWALMLLVPILWIGSRMHDLPVSARRAATALLVATAMQVALGITTLLLRVPVALGAAHQGGAVIVFAASLWVAHEYARRRATRAATSAGAAHGLALGVAGSRPLR
jgi:cytochrome c oxidase assembly protein subunit 15